MDFPALLKVEEFVIKKHLIFFSIQFHHHIVDFDGMSSETRFTFKEQLVEFKVAFYTWNNSRHDLKQGGISPFGLFSLNICEQQSQDHLEMVSVWFCLKPGVVYLQWEHNRPGTK